MIEAAFREMLDGYLASNHRKKVEIIYRAFEFAKEAHKGIRRRSGEPYIMHPIAVARIASHEIGLGSTSICAALLHDVVEDTDYTVEDIRQHFGKKIAQLVDGLTKISGGIFGDRASAQAENFRKLLLTMSEDIRVVLIKMADRLHNMRTLGSMAPNKQYKIAGETLYVYAPLAHRLGLFAIKTELEDLAFKYEHMEEYERISRLLEQTSQSRERLYEHFANPIIEKLTAMGLTFEAKARVKSVYSIWNKMQTKQIPFDEVYDLYAMRIIFECDDRAQEKGICWNIYSAITDLYKAHPQRTRDWIVNPKANGYQALHLTAMGPDGNWVEVQIRSRRMDEIAEKGFAAHWKYKIGEGDEESELNVWLKTIKDILDNPEPNAIDFLDTLKLNLFASEIVVFTPKGELITLPANSTVLDFAFSLHSEIGSRCIAAKVNHKLVPLSSKLRSGDQVEVLTSQSQTPKPEWLDFLATAKGRTRLRAALRRERQPVIAKGRKLYEEFMKAHEITESNRILTKLMGHYHAANREELYYMLGREEIVFDDTTAKHLKQISSGKSSLLGRVLRIPFVGPKNKDNDENNNGQPADDKSPVRPDINRKAVYELQSDKKHANYIAAECCLPIPGDNVFGFIRDDGQVEIHNIDCPRAQALKAGYGQRLLTTRWASVREGRFQVRVEIEGIDRFGILRELTSVISSQMSIDIRALSIEAQNEVFHANMTVSVETSEVVTRLCDRIGKIDGVKRVRRLQ